MPKYSICMCNYNMAGTLKPALESILTQIDDSFEIVIVDDGSSDDSVKVIESLQRSWPQLRLFRLERDASRHLGFTRNKSVELATGEYVLLHLDCDDIAAPYIQDFVEVFHQIEHCLQKDIMLSGRPIQMGKRDFLLTHGPYKNIHRGEDRDMWARFAAIDAYIPLYNENLKTVLPKSFSNKLYRAFYYTFDHLRNDFRKDARLFDFLRFELFHQKNFSVRVKLIRLFLTLPAWIMAKIQGRIVMEEHIADPDKMAAYRQKTGGTFEEILSRNGCAADWSKISADARSVF